MEIIIFEPITELVKHSSAGCVLTTHNDGDA